MEDINCNECVIKYINTLKNAGFTIIRKNRKYVLKKFPQNITEIDNMFNILIKIEELSKILHTNFSILEFLKPLLSEDAGEKLDLLIKEEYDLKLSKTQKMILSKFKEICEASQRLKIEYLDDEGQISKITCEPYDVIHRSGQVYLNIFNLNDFEQKLININFVKNIQHLPTKALLNQHNKNAKLMLTDKLAKSYMLRENEKIIQKNKDFIVISTTYDDKTLFMKRILRYGEFCKIISPNHLKNTYVKYISEMN
jgi:predicted DNA-binding transcriptional regulator YafY